MSVRRSISDFGYHQQLALVDEGVRVTQHRQLTDHAIAGASAAAASTARRTAVLAGVPYPFWRSALAQVEALLRGDAESLPGRRAALLIRFEQLGVAQSRVLAALGVQVSDEIGLEHILLLHGLHSALVGGDGDADDLFPDPTIAAAAKPDTPPPEGFSMARAVHERMESQRIPEVGEA